MKKLLKFFTVLFAFFLVIPGYVFPQDNLQSNLDAFVPKVLKEFQVPGIAVGVVKDSKLIFAKGYGLKNLRKNEPVDENTLFQIASNTKAFTSACLAILVDEGKLDWDDRVVDRLPGFQMSDPYVTKEMLVRDLLSHRSGLSLGAGDLLFFPKSDFTRSEIMNKLRYIKLSKSFRSNYAYDNILYPVAGELIKAVSGKTWEQFVTEKIFKPLQMNSSKTGVSEINGNDNIATPYTLLNNELAPMPFTNWDNVAPAGGILSSVTDLSKWVITQLDSGKINSDGGRLFTKKGISQLWMPQIFIPVSTPPPGLSALKTNFSAYALGWVITEYRGNKIVYHTGGLPGTVTRVTLVPDMNLGVIVLTNQESGAAFNTVTYEILDNFLNIDDTDWVERYSELVKKSKNTADAKVAKMDSLRAKDSSPSLPLKKYAGKYEDDWYGTITIKNDDGKLFLSFDHSPELSGFLEHWQYNTFVARWNDRSLHGDAFVTFSLKPDGSVDEIKMEKFRPDTDFSFDFQDLNFKPVE